MAQVTALSPTATPGLPYSFVAKDPGVGYTWTDLGDAQRPFLYTPSEWGSNAFKASARIKATTGEVFIRIYNSTEGIAVGAAVSTTSASFKTKETLATALTDGMEHVIQFGKTGADAGEVASIYGFWNVA
jgi:hypothetical protein